MPRAPVPEPQIRPDRLGGRPCRCPNSRAPTWPRSDPARGGVIDVPDQFTISDLNAVADTGDSVLAAAAAA
jgi:hypothetical protein